MLQHLTLVQQTSPSKHHQHKLQARQMQNKTVSTMVVQKQARMTNKAYHTRNFITRSIKWSIRNAKCWLLLPAKVNYQETCTAEDLWIPFTVFKWRWDTRLAIVTFDPIHTDELLERNEEWCITLFWQSPCTHVNHRTDTGSISLKTNNYKMHNEWIPPLLLPDSAWTVSKRKTYNNTKDNAKLTSILSIKPM